MLLGASTVGTEGVEEGASTVGREAPATPTYVPAGLVSTSLVAVGRLISDQQPPQWWQTCHFRTAPPSVGSNPPCVPGSASLPGPPVA